MLRAGLWEKEVRLLPFGEIDFRELFQIAQEQSVPGLVAAGLEYVADYKVPKKDALQFASQTMQLEQRNTAMNAIIGKLVGKMHEEGIHTVLMKGQGVAQCYERPLWRASGDVDFLFDEKSYPKAQAFFKPLASSEFKIDYKKSHRGVTLGPWSIELHANQHCGLSKRMDAVIADVQKDIFCNGGIRCWQTGKTEVSLPSADNDVVIIFTHFLKHFYKGGLGLRQLCDWCRLLWTYRKVINVGLLENRLKEMRLMTEWKSFAAFSVDYLGMSKESLPLYSPEARWSRKAHGILNFVLMSGNFGHSRRRAPKSGYFSRKAFSMCRRIGDLARHARLFPLDSMRFFPRIMFNGLRSAFRGRKSNSGK